MLANQLRHLEKICTIVSRSVRKRQKLYGYAQYVSNYATLLPVVTEGKCGIRGNRWKVPQSPSGCYAQALTGGDGGEMRNSRD